MIGPGNGVRVFLVVGTTDMRCGIAGLCARAKKVLGEDPASGAVFAFRGWRCCGKGLIGGSRAGRARRRGCESKRRFSLVLLAFLAPAW